MYTPHQVIVAALAQPLPDQPDGQHEHAAVEARATLIEQSLIATGHLPAPAQEMSEAQRRDAATKAAQTLAAASRHPRFTMEGGWERLLDPQGDSNVIMAHLNAVKHSPQDTADALLTARNLLLDLHQADRDAARQEAL